MSDFTPVKTGKGHADPAMCGRCGLDRTRPNKEQHMYAPCWNCVERDSQGRANWLSPVGCPECVLTKARRSQTCDRCGVYVSRWGLLYNGERLPASEFRKYPAAWQIAFWCVYGAPDRGHLMYVRLHLHDLANLHFVNTVRRDLGLEAYPEFADARDEFMGRYQGARSDYVRANNISGTIANIIEKFSKPAIEIDGEEL